MHIIDKMRGKRILIWGYGREGKSTELFLQRHCAPASVAIYEGCRDGIKEDDYDIIVKSPGIVMHEDNPKYTSQTELFLEEFSDKIIGITGTKGKSTTSAMLYSVLKECYSDNVILLGNIGIPCLDCYEQITNDTIIVFEMSCHQLAHTKFSPHIAVFLNLYEEHLDYYGSMEKYFSAKSNITKFQKNDDYYLVGHNVPPIDTKATTLLITQSNKDNFNLNLLGEHNQYNAQFVHTIATQILGCKDETVYKSLSNFKGLSHRLEYVGTVNEIEFYDDSISTIPEATINAIHSIKNIQTVIIGGMDRGIDYNLLIEYAQNNQDLKYIFIYETGKNIYQALTGLQNCYYALDLEKAVKLAKEITEAGKACVLSPAAASYGYFKNFEERGDMFKKYALDNN